ncbi:MAG: DUF362 domain-containing protein [Candidatus Aenigmarchaeota archaeon]|nr:DUF362 domain-containing protein [Candidatus Aenigmarchaeota archaeon]
MARVYFRPVDSYEKTCEVSKAARGLLERVISEEKIPLEKSIPVKVHFGEKGNVTFIEPKNFKGLLDFLKEKKIDSCFIETNALYVGSRNTKEKHVQTALEHGFTALPIVIADGENGEEVSEVEINKRRFKKCKIGKAIAESRQLIVLSHFKGHSFSGFGGAIKQLGMGCSARSGKLDQHANSHPTLNPLKCKKCGLCVKNCPGDAIELGLVPRVNTKKCLGCARCISVCPNGAMDINWLSTMPKTFHEKLAEYAYAAHQGKKNIYISFLLRIAKDCDCWGCKQDIVAKDIGVFASTDPVAIDKACWDLLNKMEGRKVFGGEDIFEYAENIGLGTSQYELIEI